MKYRLIFSMVCGILLVGNIAQAVPVVYDAVAKTGCLSFNGGESLSQPGMTCYCR